MSEFKENYYTHLKSLNPDLEGTYQAAQHYYLAEILPLLPTDKTAKILDAGCGFGHLIRFIAENGFLNVGGVECDERLYEECCRYLGKKAAFLINDDARFYLRSELQSFDMIICTDVIEHFSRDEGLAFTRELLNALKPGGRLIFRTPNMANLFGAYSRYMDLTHQMGFTEQSLSQLLHQAGFSIIQLHLPDWSDHQKARIFKWSTKLQRWIFRLQDRSMPTCFDKNIVMWATKS